MYRHQQVGRFLVATGSLLIIPFALGFVAKVPGMIAFALLFALVYWAFARLTVEVGAAPGGANELRWAMTFGWPSGRIPIAAIADATIVPVSFWMGIGIHLTLRGWVWNVSLGKGVRVTKRDGSDVILGTDDPAGLLAAIARAR